MLRTGLLALVVLATSCATDSLRARSGPSDASDDADDSGPFDAGDADSDAPSGGFELASFEGGFDDSFGLPPRFAPFFPLRGSEVTREPPGMYDQASAQYFSYALLWWLTGTPDLTTVALRDDLFVYYAGLCGAATVTLDEPLAPTPNDAGVGLSRAGTLETDYCFGAPVPAALLEVMTFDCPDHDAVLVAVSPEPDASAVWADLRRIQASFRCW